MTFQATAEQVEPQCDHLTVGDRIRERRLNERRLDDELKAVLLGILGLEQIQRKEPSLLASDRAIISDIELCRDRLSRIYDKARGV